MAKKAVFFLLPHRAFSSSTTETPTLYSFLQPSVFALTKKQHQPNSEPSPKSPTLLSSSQLSTLQTTLQNSLTRSNTDEAWKSFKTLTTHHSFPPKTLTNSLLIHLSSLGDTLNLKRAFASTLFLMEKNPMLIDHHTLHQILLSMRDANTAAPAFALVRCMFRNRLFVPFHVWGPVLVEISRKNNGGGLGGAFLRLESVSDAERVVGTMSNLGIRPDEFSFGFLGYLYALKGLEEKIRELEVLMGGFGCLNKKWFYCSLISGYIKSGDLASVEATVVKCLGDGGGGKDWGFGVETFCEVVKAYFQKGNIKGLASLIVEAQKLEGSDIMIDKSIGYGIVNACVNIGLSDKAHSILDEMNALGASVGLGVYIPILKAYCKENRTAEATQMVMEISNSGLQLDVGTYDALVEAAMCAQDFQSAFSLFRDMRDARIPDLKGSYLTIMTGLMENHRPELMAAFLDEVVEDPRIEVGTHDWNSIIHAFCKAGRLEDARRTFRRMMFLQFEPNDQTYLSMINGYVLAEKYFLVLMLWNEVKRKLSLDGQKGIKFDHNLVDAFLYAMVKGGFFDAVMQVVEKAYEMRVFVDKWRYKQAFMETHKKLKVAKLRKRNFRKMEALIAFKNWAGLNA
uniref:At1g68980-like TPR repeats domain-containing protein n=1 Tax=Glycine max TaxID=3847 RepID=A0A368UJR7_SOYBN